MEQTDTTAESHNALENNDLPQKPASSLSSSELTLRFPKAQANRQLASWISSSDPNIMNPAILPEDSGLAESYEFINSTDGESQDGRDRLSESLSSLSFVRQDDVHSLAGTERTHNTLDTNDDGNALGTDSESDEGQQEDEDQVERHSSSMQYTEQSLLNPSSPAASSAAFDQAATPLCQSIEFEEDAGPMYLKKIGVKHTICDFDEEKSAVIAQKTGIPNAPTRLVGTIRQTMSQHCLSTKEPLRILYVGSDGARHDIIYKISSALMTSISTDDDCTVTHDNNIFNVVPISAFGSQKEVPEVELLKTSQCQIKVELCTSAKAIIYEGENFPGDTVLAITIDNERTYRSAFSPSGSMIEPKWALPHVAIFYVTESDDESALKARDAAWEFMTRHSVPSIFIANSQSFESEHTGIWKDSVDQHAVHLCLESRDSNKVTPHKRLPIDLASFLNIDARQMNRNLAYLTGLQEPILPRKEEVSIKAVAANNESLWGFFKSFDNKDFVPVLNAAIPQVLMALKLMMLSLAIIYVTRFLAPVRPPALEAAPAATCSTTSTSAASTITISTSTVTINLTSTKTIRIPQAKSSSSGFAVSTFTGFASDAPVDSEKKTVCSTEIHGANEILVKIPLSTKTSWLAKDSIFIDVYRGEDFIKAKFSSVDDGIVIEIPRKEAHGVLNVSVITTRRPKVNETFEVDFGKGFMGEAVELSKLLAQDVYNRLFDMAAAAQSQLEGAMPNLQSVADNIRSSASSASGDILKKLKDAQDSSSRIATEAANQMKRTLNSETVAKRIREAKDALQQQLLHAVDIQDSIGLSVLRAQLKAKLWWLKAQGKTGEYEEYLRKAEQHLKTQFASAAMGSKARTKQAKKEMRARKKKERLEARCSSSFARWTKQCKKAA
jgi:hypothetical protein